MNLSSLPSQQAGWSVTNIALIVIIFVVGLKLAVAILPSQVGDYQLTKSLAVKLKEANADKDSPKDFLSSVQRQLEIDGFNDLKVEEMITFKSKSPGHLSIYKNYEVENNFVGSVFIVNRFEGDIEPAESGD